MADAGIDWDEHDHEAVTHAHGHYHVSHNFRDATGGFEHLSSFHEHEHAHPGVRHRHFPHEDFEREHGGEAHIHEHDAPAKLATRARKAAKKATD